MRNKRLVAAMTALSLATTPAHAWAVDLTADPADATKAGEVIASLEAQDVIVSDTSETGGAPTDAPAETPSAGTTNDGATDETPADGTGGSDSESAPAGDVSSADNASTNAVQGEGATSVAHGATTGSASGTQGDAGTAPSTLDASSEPASESFANMITGVTFNETPGGTRTLTITTDDDEKPRRVQIDGKTIDFANYSVSLGEGCSTITVHDVALAGLAAGAHTVKVTFANVTNDSAYFTVGGTDVNVKHEVADGGTWVHGSGKTLSFATNASKAPTQVSVTGPAGMGGTTTVLDSAQYDVVGTPGNLEIVLGASYLETLPAGNYTLGVCFADGDCDAASFNIAGVFGPEDDGSEDAGYTLVGGGTWTQGTSAVLPFMSNAAMAPSWVAVDGTLLTEGEHYKSYVGDTGMLVVLFPGYLSGLSVGDHEIKVNFGDNDEPTCGFVVATPNASADIDHTLVGGGTWVQGSGYTLQFDTNAVVAPQWVSISGEGVGDLARLLVGGTDYKLSGEPGSLQIELLANGALGTLPAGSYELKVHFADGDERTAAFEVVAGEGVCDYVITSGNGSSWEQESDTHLPFETDGHADDLTAVIVNGRVLAQGEDYTVFDGDENGHGDNVGVTLTDEYLSTLSVDEHDIVVAFADGDADGSFYVIAADDGTASGGTADSGTGLGSGTVSAPTTAGAGTTTSTSSGTLPKTGDPALGVGALVGAGTLAAAVGVAMRRRREASEQEGSAPVGA